MEQGSMPTACQSPPIISRSFLSLYLSVSGKLNRLMEHGFPQDFRYSLHTLTWADGQNPRCQRWHFKRKSIHRAGNHEELPSTFSSQLLLSGALHQVPVWPRWTRTDQVHRAPEEQVRSSHGQMSLFSALTLYHLCIINCLSAIRVKKKWDRHWKCISFTHSENCYDSVS